MKRALLLFLVLSGCSCFRASVGFGFGLGASARVGVLDVGALGGYSHEWGNAYGLTGGMTTGEFGIPLLGRREHLWGDEEGIDRDRAEGLYPMVFALIESGKTEYYLCRPTEIAVAAYLGFVSFHLGFEPAAVFRALTGREEPDGTEERKDEDEGSAFLEATRPIDLELLLENRSALVTRRSGRYNLAVSPQAALVASRSDTRDWVALEKRQTAKGSGDIARALASRDPDSLAAALAATPLSTEAPRVARVLGEVQLERGELEDACSAFELEALLAPTEEDALAARARLALARSAWDREAPAPLTESRSAMATLGELTLATDTESVWAVSPSNDVAWTRTDVLPEGETWKRTIGATGGLAFFETGPVQETDKPRFSFIALDDKGNEHWKTELPFETKGDREASRIYLVGGGRIYVICRAEAFAIDARSGRLEWFYSHPARVRPDEMPFDRRRLPPPFTGSPVASLRAGVLEWHVDAATWSNGEPGRVVRLRARTGVPVDEGR